METAMNALGATWIPRRSSVIASLKSAKTKFSKDLDLDEVFSLGYIQLNTFAKKLAELKRKRTIENDPFKKIDFSKVGYITDSAIKVFVKVLGKDSFTHVKLISLEGCSVVTDLGLHWLVQVLEGNKADVKININGCTKVTDCGLAELVNCPRILSIEAIATSVSHFSSGANTRGCPVLNDHSRLSETQEKESYLLIIPLDTKQSIAEYLFSSKEEERKALHYHQRIEIQDWKVNVVEAERSHVLFQHLLPPNPTHVLIPFDASLDLNYVKGQVEDTIAHVLSKEQPNPPHKEFVAGQIVQGSGGWLDCSLYSRINLDMDGVIRNLPGQLIGSVASRQPMSRTNNYFEIKAIQCDVEKEVQLIIGVLHDILLTSRFPMDSKEKSGGVVEGFQFTPGSTYGFGIEGDWVSEYVPSSNAEYYFTENGVKIPDKQGKEMPHVGIYPIFTVLGTEMGAVQVVNKVTPPEVLQQKWINENLVHTPGYTYNILCDDEGTINYVQAKDAISHVGIIQMQQDISGKNNSFAFRAIQNGSGNGALSIGLGPENYPTNAHPGWKKHSIALHGDNGKLYIETGSGVIPKGGQRQVWKDGDIIRLVVTSLKNDEVVANNDDLDIDFYVNDKLVAQTTFKVKDYNPSNRMVFMVGINCNPGVGQILNFRPLFLNPPPKMDMLTMGRTNFMDILDDGTLRYRKFDQRKLFSLYVSKTPFNKQLTYFEMKVKALDKDRYCGIGLVHRDYPINNMVGWLPASVGYHADNGEVCLENPVSLKSLSEDGIFKDGDIVGCGIDETKAVFRPDGKLENQQNLHVYFTKNGKKIHTVEFKYRTDGIFPAVSLHSEDTELQLLNYYSGAEAGTLFLQNEAAQIEKQKTQSKDFIEGCQFTVLGIGSKKSDPKRKTVALQKMMQNGPQFSTLPLIEKKLAEMDKKPESMNMQEQQLNSVLCWQKECLQRFSTAKSRLNFMSIDTSTSDNLNDLHNTIIKTCENDLEMHSKYYDLPKKTSEAMDLVMKTLKYEKLFPAYQLIKMLDQKFISNGRVYEVLVRFLQKKGRIIWLPMKRTVVAIDMAFAETLVRISETLSQKPSGKIAPCIGENSKVWMDIADMVPELKPLVQSKSELMSHVLLFFGLIEIPCIRRTKDDPKYCYCTPKALGQLPVNLNDFLVDGHEDIVVIRRDYHFFYNHPEHILSLIISRALMFSRPIAISSTWCIFQSGAVQVAIYIKNEQDLILETRCFMPSSQTNLLNVETKRNVEEYSWTVFCIFIDVIDLIIQRIRLKVTYSQNVPAGLVNSSIGCLHVWGLSEETYRQTRCTLCNWCCEKGRNCPYNGVPGTYQHQCGCGTIITGCRDCGICQNCADTLWTIRSYLRPNMEVACYGDLKSSQLFPLNATTYDEIEITNLGRRAAPVCLRSFFDLASSLTLMFPGVAMEVPSASSLDKILSSAMLSSELSFNQGDIVTVRLDPIKRDHKILKKEEEVVVKPSDPVYFTAICRDIVVWHDTGILAYNSMSGSMPVAQFISAMPLTPEVPSFSFEIVNRGKSCYIAIGLCPKRYQPGRAPGWNKGSVGYHADDGGLFLGSGSATKKSEKCTKGDIMKCEIDFEQKVINFYKNGNLIFKTPPQNNSNLLYHAFVSLHSVGEVVRLLEKEPWSVKEVEERQLPAAVDSYKYGNMYISPGHTLSLYKARYDLQAWLMLHNPSKNVVGYKILPGNMDPLPASFLKPGETYAKRLSFQIKDAIYFSQLVIHWFLLESSRDYSTVDLETIYEGIAQESLLKHRLHVKVKDSSQMDDTEKLKVATLQPDSSDGYLAEVFKNGISVQKYWLRDDSYVCSIPIECNVLVRYPKFPTLNHPDSLQKGMRLIVDLTATEKDTFAEGWIKEVSPKGMVKLEYSLPGRNSNSEMEIPATSPLINLKEINYEKVLKEIPSKNKKSEKNEKDAEDDDQENTKKKDAEDDDQENTKKKDAEDDDQENTKKKDAEDDDQETTMVAVLNILSYEPRGNIAAIKCGYKFAPFHLLTKASQDALKSLDSSWEFTTLQSVAVCKTMPTRVTVQELQISEIAGDTLDWLIGANFFENYDAAFAFLPSQLDLNNLCYPIIPSIFNKVDVHRLCLQADQMNYCLGLSKDHGIMPDIPLHFANVEPITPEQELKAEDMYASAFNGWTYSTLYLNKLLLPLCDNMFHEGKPPSFERQDLEYLMKCMIHIYASQCHLFAEQRGGIAFQETSGSSTKTITNAIEYKNELVVREPQKVEVASNSLFKPFKYKDNAICKAHLYCTEGAAMLQEDVFTLRFEQIDPYQETINIIYRKMPGLTTLPRTFFSFFPNLQYLKLSHCDSLHIIPNGISECKRLEMVSLDASVIVQLSEDFFQSPSLMIVHCNGLLVKDIPQNITDSCHVKELKLTSMLLRTIPPELSLMTSLEVLNLDGNPLEDLPIELSSLVNLTSLHLSGIQWLSQGTTLTELSITHYEEFLEANPSVKNYLGKERAMALFKEYDKNNNSSLDTDEIAALNSFLFWNIPRIGAQDINDTEYGGIPPVIFMLTSLENLYLDYQAITAVPDHISRLQNLRVLSVSHNPLLERLPGALGHSPSLKVVRVLSNPSLQTPPHEVYSRGFVAIKAYLKRLAEGLSECRRTKLMFVGLGGAGKTSLLTALMSVNKKIDEKTKEEVTDGIMIVPWTVKTSNNVEITYSTWDFAGQTLYYNTHQFFLSKRAVYLLLWSARQGFEHSGIDFWLNSIASHTSEAPIFVVATHCDEVPQAPIPQEELKKCYPQIAGFFFVSSKTGANIYELEQEMLKVTLAQKNMGEQVPQVWLNLEKKILAARQQDDILDWDIIKQFAIEVGIYDDKDVREAITFLNELGTVQYFDTNFLRHKVVINPQWIVNVMACVVSVKDSPIQEQLGRFLHKDIPKIWSKYDPKLHTWLLQLTEEFDLTFPLPKEEINIVPCILPQEKPPGLQWPKPDFQRNIKETKIVYKFEFLPAGLFNRAQVRLFQLSDGKLMWKKGSLLKKNKHLALVEQISEKQLIVKVQGPRPENVIFLIHEIFESLLEESFHGVKYDFMVPCPDCIEKECTLEPSLFKGHLIRKASDFRAPFLQCRKYFHTISMTQLLEIMPSNSTTDFDAHLQTSLQILQEMNEAISKDVAILVCPKDASSSDIVSPQQFKADLEAVGYSCWISDDCAEQNLIMAIQNCRIMLVLCSDNFERNSKFRDTLLYSLDSLKRPFVIVSTGSSRDWMNTNMGMRIGKQELMVMVENKTKYDNTKKEELRDLVKIKLSGLKKKTRKYCSVFLSYCWENSSIAKNGEVKPGAAGWGDPRIIKQQLEERGVSCWLDVENIASCSGENKGLFQTIAESMNNSKVILVCISDEYIRSENCMRELRFGILNLKKPAIFAIVGTGKKWKKSEAELLRGDSISSEMTVNLQTPNEGGYDELEQYIRELLPFNAEELTQKEAIQKDMEILKSKEKEKKSSGAVQPDKNTMQEECELLQRKFMRYIISYISSQDTVLMPRLFVIDFEKPTTEFRAMDFIDGSVRSSLARSSSRPRTASRSYRGVIVSAVLDEYRELWEAEMFCIKLLCENEQGWHVCKTSHPIKLTEANKDLIGRCSAYLARMYAILQQSSVVLHCFEGTQGEKFLAWIEESAGNDVNFVEAYTNLRSNLVEDVGAQAFLGQLQRYHLPTGKIYWLCEDHSKGPRIIHLSTESVSNKEVMKMLEEEDIKMRENMEYTVKQKKEIKRDPKAKKIILPNSSLRKSSSSQSAKEDTEMDKAKEQTPPEKPAPKNIQEEKAEEPPSQVNPAPNEQTVHPPTRQNSTTNAKANIAASSSKPTSNIARKNTPSAKSDASSHQGKPGSKTCILQ